MKKMFMAVMVLGLSLCVMGNAHAVTYVNTMDLSGIVLSGAGSTSWNHSTPATLNVPYDVVNSATVEVFACGVSGGNDLVRVGTASATLQNQAWSWDTWQIEGTTLNVANSFSTWTGGNPLTVTLNYNEPLSFFGDWVPIHLVSSVLTVDYDNGNPTPGSAVPEPATMALLGTGLVGLLGLKRKK